MIYKPKIFEFSNQKALYTNLVRSVEQNLLENSGEHSHGRLLVDSSSSLFLREISNSTVLDWSSIEVYSSSEALNEGGVSINSSKQISDSLGEDVVENLRSFYTFKKGDVADSKELYTDVIDSLDGIYFDHAVLSITKEGLIGGVKCLDKDNLINVSDGVISINPEVLLNSRDISLILDFPESDEVLKELLEGPKSILDFPAKILFSHPSATIYFVR